jgi:hypothetical protein
VEGAKERGKGKRQKQRKEEDGGRSSERRIDYRYIR